MQFLNPKAFTVCHVVMPSNLGLSFPPTKSDLTFIYFVIYVFLQSFYPISDRLVIRNGDYLVRCYTIPGTSTNYPQYVTLLIG